jgi:uncharacterized protein with PQ loop repeat
MLEYIGAAAFAVSVALFVPQAITVWRSRNDPNALRGVSMVGQWLLLCNAGLWAVYGIGVGAWWTAAPSFVNGPLAAFVLYLLRRARHRSTLPALDDRVGLPLAPVTDYPVVPHRLDPYRGLSGRDPR